MHHQQYPWSLIACTVVANAAMQHDKDNRVVSFKSFELGYINEVKKGHAGMSCGRNCFGVGFEKKGGSGSLMGDISKCLRHCRMCSDLQHEW